MEEIDTRARAIADMMAEKSAPSSAQRDAIPQVTTAVPGLDQMLQQTVRCCCRR